MSATNVVYSANSMAVVATNPPTTTAAAPRRTQNNEPLTHYLIDTLWQVVFSYLTPYQRVSMRYVEPGFRNNIVRLELDTELAGICSSVEIIAMSKKFYPSDNGRKTLEALAERRNALSNDTSEEALKDARALRNDLIEIMKDIPPSSESNKKDENSWSSSALRLFEISRVRDAFGFAPMREIGRERYGEYVTTLYKDSIKHNLGTLHHQWITQLKWDDRIADKKNRDVCCLSLLNSYEADKKDEEALTFFQEETRIPQKIKGEHLRKIIDRLLEQGEAYVWDLMRVQQPPELTAEETEAANIALKMAEEYLKYGEIQEACNIMADNLMFTDPATNILRFPEQAMKFFELLVNLPRGIHAKINVKIAEAYSLAVSVGNAHDIKKTLNRLIVLLPDNAQKMALIEKAIEINKIFIASVKETILSYKDPLERRSMQLYKLACVLLKEGDVERFFSITRSLTSPILRFGCLDLFLNFPKLLSAYSEEFLKIFDSLPDEYKFLLIEQAKTKKCVDFAALLEKQFNRFAFKQRAEKEFQITVGFDHAFELIGRKMIKDRVTNQDIERLYLLAWDSEKLWDRDTEKTLLEATNHDAKLKSALDFLVEFSDLKFCIRKFCEDIFYYRAQFDKEHTTIKRIFALPVALQMGILRHLRDFIKTRRKGLETPELYSSKTLPIQNHIEAFVKGEEERLEKAHSKTTVVSNENELFTAKEIDDVIHSDLLLSAMVKEVIKDHNLRRGNNHLELEAVGIVTWNEDIERRMTIMHCSDVLQHWSLRHFDVSHMGSRKKVTIT